MEHWYSLKTSSFIFDIIPSSCSPSLGFPLLKCHISHSLNVNRTTSSDRGIDEDGADTGTYGPLGTTHPRAGSTVMPTGRPTPREVPSLVISVFPYLVSPWSVTTYSPNSCIRTEFLLWKQRWMGCKA